MNILVIHSPQVFPKKELPFRVFPLGLSYIISTIKKEGHEVDILDHAIQGKITRFRKDFYIKKIKSNELKKFFSGYQHKNHRKGKFYDLILLDLMFSLQHYSVISQADMFKEFFPDAKIVIGGNHASAIASELLKKDSIDYIIHGEGEKPIIRLIDILSGKKRSWKSISRKSEGKIIINNNIDLIKNLDQVQFPYRWGLEYYANKSYKHTLFNATGKTAEVITSRGCPYNCGFCASHVISGWIWRRRSIHNIIEEITLLKKKYNIKEIHFEDDAIATDRSRFIKLCEELKGLNLKWTLPNGINISHLDKDIIKLMSDSGCYALFLPIESTNRKILKRYVDKKIELKHISEIVRYAKELKLYLVGFFMIGFPEEDKQGILKTINFAADLGLDEAHFSIASPYPGTKFYNEHREDIKDYLICPKFASINGTISKRGIVLLRNRAYIIFEIKKFLKKPLSYFNIRQIRRILRFIF